MFRRLKTILLFSFALIAIFTLLLFDTYAKPQSDDWGFLAFIQELGYIDSYSSMRETYQMTPYMWLVMFPVILLQYYVPYGILLFVIQISLPVSMYVFAKKRLVIQNRLDQLELFAALIIVSILIYLTAWNTNTFQNAIFWLTGSLAYVLPIALYFIFLDLILKIEKTIIDKMIILMLTFLLVGIQINYILIFGLVGLLLFVNKKIRTDNFFKRFVCFGVLSAVYTWTYSGWLNRIPIGNNLELSEKVINFGHLFVIGFAEEPTWTLSIFCFGIFLAKFIKRYVGVLHWKIVIITSCIILFSSLLILIAFNGSMGYGRVQFITHFMVALFSIYLIFLIPLKVVSKGYLPLLFSIILFVYPLKSKIWRAQRFSEAWVERENNILVQKKDGAECIFVERLPKSNLLGYVDLNESVTCDTLVGCKGDLEYKKINYYDNWVHKKHYNHEGNIVILDE